MPKRIKLVIFFLTLIFCYIIFIEKNLPTTDDLKLSADHLCLFSDNSLKEISFNNLHIIRENNSFKILEPFQYPASKENCSELFNNFSKIVKVSRIPYDEVNKSGLDFFGLNPPKYIIKLVSDKYSKTILIGNKINNPVISECYAKEENDKAVYVIKDNILNFLEQKNDFFIDSDPFTFLNKGSCEIRWKNNDSMTLLRRVHKNFFIGDEKRFIWHAGSKDALFFINTIISLKVSPDSLINIPDSECGIDNPYMSVEFFGEENVKKILYIGNKIKDSKNRYAKFDKNGLAIPIPTYMADLFTLNFEKLASKNVYDGNINLLNEVVFNFNDTKTTLKFFKKDEQWFLENKYNWLLDSTKILNYILRFIIYKADNFTKQTRSNPLVSVYFNYETQKIPPEKVAIYKNETDENIFIQHNDQDTTVKTDSALLDLVYVDPYYFITSCPFKKLLETSASVKIISKDKSFIFIKNDFDKWNSNDKHFDVEAFIKTFENLKCHTAIQAKKGIDFGFDNPVFEIEFIDSGKVFFNLKIGSFSNDKECFILANNDFFIFYKNSLLLKTLNDLLIKEDE